MSQLNCVSLFTGSGIGDLAAEAAGFTTVLQCENEPFCLDGLNVLFPNVRKVKDVKKLNRKICKEVVEKHGKIRLLIGGFPCFPAGTPVLTDVGERRIESVKVGDRMLTHKGRYKKVVRTGSKYAPALLKITATGALPFRVTCEHPFWARERKYVWDSALRRYVRIFTKPEWVPAERLTTKHFIAQPIDRFETDRKWESEEFWYMIGRYLGDGWFCNGKRKSKIKRGRGSRINSRVWKVVICTARIDGDDLERRIKVAGFHATRDNAGSVTKFIICSQRLTEFVMQFGRYADGKYIPEWVLGAPVRILKALWAGYMDADGNEGKNAAENTSTVSRDLAAGMARAARRAFCQPVAFYRSVREKTCVIEGRVVNQQDAYQLRRCVHRQIGFEEDGIVWEPVRRVQRIPGREVFNIEVEHDHTYIAASFLVHNCIDISTAGKGAGITGAASGLWFEMYRVTRILRPDWCLFENVPPLRIRGADRVLAGMDKAGYDCWPVVAGAWAAGAPHVRNRVWIVCRNRDIPYEQPVADAGSVRRHSGGSEQSLQGVGASGEAREYQQGELAHSARNGESGSGSSARSNRLRVGKGGDKGIGVGLADSDGGRAGEDEEPRIAASEELADTAQGRQRTDRGARRRSGYADQCGKNEELANARSKRTGSNSEDVSAGQSEFSVAGDVANANGGSSNGGKQKSKRKAKGRTAADRAGTGVVLADTHDARRNESGRTVAVRQEQCAAQRCGSQGKLADTECVQGGERYGITVQRRRSEETEQVGMGNSGAGNGDAQENVGNTAVCGRNGGARRIGRSNRTAREEGRTQADDAGGADYSRSEEFWPAEPGQPQYDWEYPRLTTDRAGIGCPVDPRGGEFESSLVRAVNGLPRVLAGRIRRGCLRVLGNAWVPQIPYEIFRWIRAQLD